MGWRERGWNEGGGVRKRERKDVLVMLLNTQSIAPCAGLAVLCCGVVLSVSSFFRFSELKDGLGLGLQLDLFAGLV